MTDPASLPWRAKLLARLKQRESSLDKQESLSRSTQVLAYVIALLATFSRSPSYFTHAQFYAEDGFIWFEQAYNLGWLQSLLILQAGYLSTIERLGTGPAMLVPVLYAPLVMVIAGLLVQALPVVVLLSARCRDWATLPTRILWAALYVALPNSEEVHVVLTNSMWHLAVAVAMLAFAAAPRTWIGKSVDILVFAIAGVSGPFSILMIPFVIAFWWMRRNSWTLVVVGVLGASSLAQLALYATHHAQRMQKPLGATLAIFLRLLGGDVFISSLVGANPLIGRLPFAVILISVAGGGALCLYVLRYASLELRLFLLYCFILLPVELRSPLVSGTQPLWLTLIESSGGRYWYLPMFAFICAAAWCAVNAKQRLFEFGGAAVLLMMCIGIVKDWSMHPFPDEHFAASVQRLHQARPGEHVIIPIPPAGWSADLVKRGP